MKHLPMIGLAILVVFAFACSTQNAGKRECRSCQTQVKKVSPRDGLAVLYDRGPK